jgi:hypothetical protein
MRIITPLLFAIVLVLQTGCAKDHNRPADLPKLYPVRITIMQEGTPLTGALVTLEADTPAKFGVAMSETNNAGVATMMTYGYPGVPLGQYTVMVDKQVVEGARQTTNEYGESVEVGGKIYRYVDAQYIQKSSSPFSINVIERGATETFDVGKPVHIFVADVPVN